MGSKPQKNVQEEATINTAELIIQTSIKTSREWKQIHSVQVTLSGPISFTSERKPDSRLILQNEKIFSRCPGTVTPHPDVLFLVIPQMVTTSPSLPSCCPVPT